MSSFETEVSKKEGEEGEVPPFVLDKHVAYIKAISNDKESFEFTVSQHFRMSGVYWGLTALCLLGKNIADELDAEEITSWVMSCQHEDGGCVHETTLLLLML